MTQITRAITLENTSVTFEPSYTAVSTKVVPQKHKSVLDNADWYYGLKEFGVD